MDSVRESGELPTKLAAGVAELEAKGRIRHALAEYFEAVQRHDWATVTSLFVPSARLDYGTPGVRGVEENIRLLRAGVERLTAASTLLGMHCLIEVRQDGTASSHTSGFTTHTPADGGPAARMSAVTYEDAWSLQADGTWRITQRTCHHEFKGWLRLRRVDADPGTF